MNYIILQRVPALKDSIRQVYRRYCGDPPTLNAATAKDFANRGVHLTGRNRFYKFVGVKRVDPPWDSKEVVLTVDSPISAGVDNTQSATGVHTSLATDVVKKQRLMPRKPGSTRTNDPVNWYGVTLDGKIVKTPLGQTLAVPSEMLAWAIAAEWDAQERRLRPAQMPLMTLVCTALDQTTAAPEVAQANSLTYLPTDTICYWADPVEDRLLHRKQHEAWDSIHNYCETSFGARAAVAVGANEGLLLSRVQGLKSIGLPHPAKIVNGAQQFVQSLDAWHLTALSVVASEAKSFLAAAALLSGSLNPKDAVEAARIEEEFQISIWGMVEGQHDYDRLNCSIQMHAAHMLISSIAMDNNNL